jgi:DNA-binding PadR family transcriptional regulator
VSFGSLYPTLRKMQAAGWVTTADDERTRAAAGKLSGRSKVEYELTAEGKEHFAELLAEAGPSAWEDESFGVHLAFFSQTDAAIRLRVLEGRRGRLEERQAGLRSAFGRMGERMDAYTTELQRHGLDSVEREVRWLDELINRERSDQPATSPPL